MPNNFVFFMQVKFKIGVGQLLTNQKRDCYRSGIGVLWISLVPSFSKIELGILWTLFFCLGFFNHCYCFMDLKKNVSTVFILYVNSKLLILLIMYMVETGFSGPVYSKNDWSTYFFPWGCMQVTCIQKTLFQLSSLGWNPENIPLKGGIMIPSQFEIPMKPHRNFFLKLFHLRKFYFL